MSPETETGVVLWGASGRMGSEVIRLLAAEPGLRLVQAVVSAGSEKAGQTAGGEVQYSQAGPLDPRARVVVDFSNPGALRDLLDRARAARVPVVSGTTGLDEEARKALQSAAAEIAVFWAPNFSVGVAALLVAVRAVKSVLAGFDVEIVEAHHSGKKDAPSGTAIRILEAVRSGATEPEIIHGRDGIQPRRAGEIGVHAVRGGSNPGRHEVHFQGRAEDVVLTHQAYSREVFAAGALRAARFVVNAPPGLYGMDDLLRSEDGAGQRV